PAPGAIADQANELRAQQELSYLLASRVDAIAGQDGRYFRPGELMAASQRPLERRMAAREEAFLQLQPADVTGHRGDNSRRRELEHPVDVRRQDEVPGWPQNVRSQHVAAVDGQLNRSLSGAAHPQSHRPFGGCEVLRLHRAQVGYHTHRTSRARLRD